MNRKEIEGRARLTKEEVGLVAVGPDVDTTYVALMNARTRKAVRVTLEEVRAVLEAEAKNISHLANPSAFNEGERSALTYQAAQIRRMLEVKDE